MSIHVECGYNILVFGLFLMSQSLMTGLYQQLHKIIKFKPEFYNSSRIARYGLSRQSYDGVGQSDLVTTLLTLATDVPPAAKKRSVAIVPLRPGQPSFVHSYLWVPGPDPPRPVARFVSAPFDDSILVPVPWRFGLQPLTDNDLIISPCYKELFLSPNYETQDSDYQDMLYNDYPPIFVGTRAELNSIAEEVLLKNPEAQRSIYFDLFS